MRTFEPGQRLHIPGRPVPEWVTVDFASAVPAGGWRIYVKGDDGVIHAVDLTDAEAEQVRVLTNDGQADSARVLAGLWTRWMSAAEGNANATVLASMPLRPYAHQSNAVYGAMLPQPRLRFLLADEPGTGKTIMAGLYLREMQKLGLVRRALIVCPAALVTKWQDDFRRFFGGELRRITNDTIQQHGLAAPHDMWVVGLELAAVNPSVQEAIHPKRAGWDVVVFDEAHRLTPTAETFHQLGRMLGMAVPRALLMTATPHRGSEWLFRHLLRLVDPDVYPDPGSDPKANLRPIKPSPVHFLRRMKENLVDYDRKTPLFKGRQAHNCFVPLNAVEHSYYTEALQLVDDYFPPTAAPLARMVYGKRAASSLYSLGETLKRRRDLMGSESPVEAAHHEDPYDEDLIAQDEARVTHEASRNARAERKAINDLLARLKPLFDQPTLLASKWTPMIADCLAANDIRPGNGEQAVLFTEYADSADWIVKRLQAEGFTARRYSGRDQPSVRDQVRADFMAGKFQIIVSTDAGNEGIDLQSAHVLVNYDIPWSLVRLEQRMGRIHRIGQQRDVELYNLVAQGTREGEVIRVLLENFVNAANQLSGQMFDSLSLVGELTGLGENRISSLLSDAYAQDDQKRTAALEAVKAVTAARLKSAAEETRRTEAALASTVDVAAAIQRLNVDTLERINPAIVEAFLARLHTAGVLDVSKTAAGEGILRLASFNGALHLELNGGRAVLVAMSGKALTDAQMTGATLTNVVSLGPGEPAFHALLETAARALGPDLFQGGLVADPTSIDDYDLFIYEGVLAEANGQRTTPWAKLIRVDSIGARKLAWEILANLTPVPGAVGKPIHPAPEHDAHARAVQLAAEEEKRRREAMTSWLTNAEHELAALPSRITRDMLRDERIAARQHLDQMVADRLADLRRLSQVSITDIRLTAHVTVRAAGIPLEPTEKDSEPIAMKRVRDLLKSDGWAVADVHTEGRGYDLYATRGQAQRCIEAKGVWDSAASEGIRLTGNEILIATQQRADYWLYVIDNCHNGTGQVFGIYRDPISRFDGLIKQDAVFRLPGSALVAAKGETMPA